MNSVSDAKIIWALETALRGYLSTSDRPMLDLEMASRELFGALSAAAEQADEDKRPEIEDCRARFQIAIGRILRERIGQQGRIADPESTALIESWEEAPEA